MPVVAGELVLFGRLSRKLSRGDVWGAYHLLDRAGVPVGDRGPVLLGLIDTVPDWAERVNGFFDAQRAAVPASSTEGDPSEWALIGNALLRRGDPLSGVEARMVGMVADGFGNAEIAVCEHVTVEAVKSRMRKALWKLGARNRAQAVAVAIRTRQI